MNVVAGIRDLLFLDRLRLEFAGLANQILSADRLMIHELEVLVEACKKAARIGPGFLGRASGRGSQGSSGEKTPMLCRSRSKRRI